MNKNIAFHGGNSIYTLGPASDGVVFFKAVDRFVPQARSDKAFDVITDRLFRKYLREDELEPASLLMQEIEKKFAFTRNQNIDWLRLGVNEDISQLKLNGNNLADVFEKFFRFFAKAMETCLSFKKSFDLYQPVRILFADLPDFMIDKRRSLAEYNQNEGPPFWLR